MVQPELKEAAFSEAVGATDAVRNSGWVVMKFGGTSVSTATNWRTIVGLIRNRLDDGLKPLIVHSALRGISNELGSALDAAASGDYEGNLAALRDQHYRLADDLGVAGQALLEPIVQELERLLAGVRLIQEISPRLRARVLAMGELMSTTLGASWLEKCGLECEWLDARKMLTSEDRPHRPEARNYLSATCQFAADPRLQKLLASSGKVVLTQGFIASNSRGETVLLGREGSDTSAA